MAPERSPGVARPQAYDFKLEGGGKLEDVPADDVATFIHEVVRIVARAAGHAVGRPVKDTGRPEAIVSAASSIRLKRVRSGSVLLTFVPSKPTPLGSPLELGLGLGLNAETVSERALSIARDAAGDRAEAYPDVAGAWADLADRVGVSQRYQRVVVSAHGDPRVSVVDAVARDHLRSIAEGNLRSMGADVVRGVLYEANFETLKAKLRNQRGDVVDVEFDLDQASDIKEALRNPTTVSGKATYDRRSMRILSVRLERIERPVQLLAEDFWTDRPVAELMRDRTSTAVREPASLRMPDVSTAEWSAFFDALADAT